MSLKKIFPDSPDNTSFHRKWLGNFAISFLLLCTASIQVSAAPQVQSQIQQPVTDDAFVRAAFASAQTEIVLSQIALQQSRNSGVKKIAGVIIKDNKAANDQLRVLAAARKLEVPTLLEKDAQQQIEQLKSADKGSFDTVYRGNIQRINDVAIELFAQIAKNPRADAELRVFATQRLTIYKKHSQMIAKLNLPPARPGEQRASKAVQQQASR